MRVALVGSDCEENLGLAMIAASLVGESHQVQVIPFNDVCDIDRVLDAVLRHRPKLVGLGIQFQHRSADFLRLARMLRQRGYAGHITCGGQYPTMAWTEVLANDPAVDTIVLHEGERTIVQLCAALLRRESLFNVPGLALRRPGAEPTRTASRALCADLDVLPFAYRYRAPARHLGLAFRPVWGSRGCWGNCAFCSITTYYRDARAFGGGRTLRLRSVENLADEMAALWHATGDTTLFCFHDETLLLPRPADTLARLGALRKELDQLGVGEIGIVGKCRPDCVTAELAIELRRLGVVRMFVGVENGSQRGLDHLGRRTTLEQVERALIAFETAGIFVCYNLLLFEPDCVLDDVRANIEFIRRHAHIPVNFCRAEPYHGTPLYHRVRQRGTLMGSYLGWDYRIHDNRTELAFRIAAAVFRERNFDAEGVANRTMGLGYTAQLLRCFYNVHTFQGRRLLERTRQLTRDISLDTAKFLEQAVTIAQACDLADHGGIARETALLGLRVAAHNRLSHAALDDLVADVCGYADAQPRQIQRISMPDKARAAIERMTLAGCFAASLQACGGSTDDGGHSGTSGSTATTVGGNGTLGGSNTGGYIIADPPPPTGGRASTGSTSTGGYLVVNMVPPTGGHVGTGGSNTGGVVYGDGGAPAGGSGSGGKNVGTKVVSGGQTGSGGSHTGGIIYGDSTGGAGGFIADPVPPTGGRTGFGGSSASGGYQVDTLPFPTGGAGGASTTSGTQATGGFIVDCVVRAGGVGSTGSMACAAANTIDTAALARSVDLALPECSNADLSGEAVVENWRDSGPRRFMRSGELALSDPPAIRLRAVAEACRVRVEVQSDQEALTYRWESEGSIEGTGSQVYWTPANQDDALCVAARGRGGVAVAMLRATVLSTG